MERRPAMATEPPGWVARGLLLPGLPAGSRGAPRVSLSYSRGALPSLLKKGWGALPGLLKERRGALPDPAWSLGESRV